MSILKYLPIIDSVNMVNKVKFNIKKTTVESIELRKPDWKRRKNLPPNRWTIKCNINNNFLWTPEHASSVSN